MPSNGATNSVFIMQLTKEQLTAANEQGLSISTRNGNIKIVAILNDVYGVNHCDTNSKLVKWWMFENFERNEAKIEQPKPKIDFSILKEGDIYFAKSTMYEYVFKFRISSESAIIWDSNILLRDSEIYNGSGGIKFNYVTELRLPTESELELFYSKFPELKPKPKYNGRAVKCDNLEQIKFVAKNEGSKLNIEHYTFNNWNQCIIIETKESYELHRTDNKSTNSDFEIISFSDYCKENGIKEPKWIQGFEVGKDYNDVVMVSDNFKSWHINILQSVNNGLQPFNCGFHSWKYCRYLNKNEFNEIKFSN